ncbi:hypothetical protein [Metabacillus kandeliae]|nr:hypothetical protein [Metabacillus kandeliae]
MSNDKTLSDQPKPSDQKFLSGPAIGGLIIAASFAGYILVGLYF